MSQPMRTPLELVVPPKLPDEPLPEPLGDPEREPIGDPMPDADEEPDPNWDDPDPEEDALQAKAPAEDETTH